MWFTTKTGLEIPAQTRQISLVLVYLIHAVARALLFQNLSLLNKLQRRPFINQQEQDLLIYAPFSG